LHGKPRPSDWVAKQALGEADAALGGECADANGVLAFVFEFFYHQSFLKGLPSDRRKVTPREI
jgi:hypothetical protein